MLNILDEDDNIIHVDGSVDPSRDIETINLELIFSDIEILERRRDRTSKALKGDKTLAGELAVIEKNPEGSGGRQMRPCPRSFAG